jgi:DnaK suppressor protein
VSARRASARLRRFEARLTEHREGLLREGAIRAEPTRQDDGRVGMDEDAQPLAEMSQAIASSRNKARGEELRRIDRALKRLAEEPELFGLCTQCEEEIGDRRLDVAPWAELCVDCQARRDAPRGGTRRHAGDFVD